MDFNQNKDQPIISSDFPQNYNKPITPNDFPQNNAPLINASDLPQNFEQPPIPTAAYQNYNNSNINNYFQNNNLSNNYPHYQNNYIVTVTNHIDNYGYFTFQQNRFMKLENQQKIKIFEKSCCSSLKYVIMIFFFILFPIGGFLAGISRGLLVPIPIIAFFGFFFTGLWINGVFDRCCSCCNKSYIYYNIENKNIEINLKKKMKINMDSIDKIKMEVDTKGSNFYIITKLGEKTEFLKLPLINGVPFAEAEVILNDFINFWKNKDGNTLLCPNE